MHEPAPHRLEGEDLMIAALVRAALRDQRWHAFPEVAARVGGHPAEAVAGVLALMVAARQVEEAGATHAPRYRLAPRG